MTTSDTASDTGGTLASSPTGSSPTYELCLAGHLDDHWSGMLGDLTLTRHPDGITTLTGPITDQAQLHGVLARVRDLGVALLSVRAVEDPEAGSRSEVATLTHPILTNRLTLRPATAEDAAATWAYRRLDSVGEWLTELPTSLQSYRTGFAEPVRLANTVIVELADGTLVGDFMLRVEDAWAQTEVADQARGRQAELGWVLDPAHTGHGYATEAVRALLDHCFTELRAHRVYANCFATNDASARLMDRLGMRREGHAVAESLHRSGQWLDTLTYAMLAIEWPH